MSHYNPDPTMLAGLTGALERGLSVSAAAKVAGIARTYVYALAKKHPHLAELLEERRRTGRAKGGPQRPRQEPDEAPDLAAQAPRPEVERIEALAISTLEAVMRDEEATAPAKVSAARAALSWTATEEALRYKASLQATTPATSPPPAADESPAPPAPAAPPAPRRWTPAEVAAALGIKVS